MPRTLQILITVVFIASLSAVTAFAQQAPVRSVLNDYHKGEDAVKNRKWDDAIAALTAAVIADPKDRLYRDGVITDKYFPHHYLFIAYTEKGDLAKARENFALRGVLPQDFAAQEAPYVARLAGPGGPTSGGPGPGPGGPAGPAGDRALAPYRAGVDAIKAGRWPEAITALNNAIRADAEDKPRDFEKRGTIPRGITLADEESRFPKEVDFARNLAAGDDASGKQQLQAAIDGWKRACAALPDECNSRQLNQKITDATNTLAHNAAANEVAQHVLTAKSLVSENDLDGAKKEFQLALAKDPGSADATAGLRDIATREKNYTDAKVRAVAAMKANPPDLNAAKREYDAALAAHPRWFRDRDKLDATLTSITATEAKTAFQEGRYDAAKQAAETVLAKNPNYADMKSIVARSESRILYEDGRKIAVAGDYYQADSKFKDAITRDSANAAAQKALDTSLQYQFYVAKKAFPQAQNLDRVRFDRERPDLDFDKVAAIKEANDSFASTDYGSARKKIEEVIQRDPTNTAALALRRRIVNVQNAAKAAEAPVVAVQTAAPQATPLLPMWMWGAIAVVAFVGAGSIVVVRSRTPMPVAIDALPWAHVSIHPVGRFTRLARSEGTTPFSIDLPKGEYDLKVTSESISEPYSLRIRVVPGQTNKVLVTMPAYDVDDILSGLLG